MRHRSMSSLNSDSIDVIVENSNQSLTLEDLPNESSTINTILLS